jgi:metal-responsive CopG/Arc/MetJ family transcriptional regulator
MKTIAITIDEDIVQRLDRLFVTKNGSVNRSLAIREALRDYVTREERLVEERREQEIFRKHRVKLARQAEALIKDQARVEKL